MKVVLPLVFFAALIAAPTVASETVLADFEGDSYAPWRVQGDAFGSRPAAGTLPDQQTVSGFEGNGLANSYVGGDGSTGKLVSPEFTISNDYISFLIGGGNHVDTTCINLVLDGKVVRTATGSADEKLELQGWDVRDLRGKRARIEIVDDATGQWGHINVDRIALTDQAPPIAQVNATRQIPVAARWLNFPVKNGALKRWITVHVDGAEVRRFDIELADGEPDWWAPLDVAEWKGRTIEVTVDRLPPDSEALANISNAADVPGTGDLYAEPLRPQFHFSARRGWLNDPNGLVYYNGEYHLFFQHNPYGREWGNMHWGHAVSSDLVHWREVGEALFPDELGTIYSGSAVVDEKNTSGFGRGGRSPMVLFYTAAGEHAKEPKPYTQAMACSIDGRTFTKYEGNPIIDEISAGNRDPKVYWHEPTRKWVMALWGEEDGHHVVFFFTSPDLKKWTRTQALKGSRVGQGGFLFECPDFFELPVDGDPKKTKWVIFGANGEYGLGDFDGRRFTIEEGPYRGIGGDVFYAAQTFANEPKGRRVLIPWLRGAVSPGMPFNQCMGIPMELRLRTTPEGVRLTYTPVEELKSLRAAEESFAPLVLKSGETQRLPGVDAELVEVRAKLRPPADGKVTLSVRGIPVIYDAATGELSVNGVTAKARLDAGALDLAIYVDRTTIEVIASNGEAFIPLGVLPDPQNRRVEVSSEGGETTFAELEVFELKSAWATP